MGSSSSSNSMGAAGPSSRNGSSGSIMLLPDDVPGALVADSSSLASARGSLARFTCTGSDGGGGISSSGMGAAGLSNRNGPSKLRSSMASLMPDARARLTRGNGGGGGSRSDSGMGAGGAGVIGSPAKLTTASGGGAGSIVMVAGGSAGVIGALFLRLLRSTSLCQLAWTFPSKVGLALGRYSGNSRPWR